MDKRKKKKVDFDAELRKLSEEHHSTLRRYRDLRHTLRRQDAAMEKTWPSETWMDEQDFHKFAWLNYTITQSTLKSLDSTVSEMKTTCRRLYQADRNIVLLTQALNALNDKFVRYEPALKILKRYADGKKKEEAEMAKWR